MLGLTASASAEHAAINKKFLESGTTTMDLRGSSLKKNLIPPPPLPNFEMQAYYQNEPRFNGVYSRDNLPDKIKHGSYIVNLDEYHDIGSHWIAYVNNKTVTYFDSSEVEHIPKELKKNINNKNIIANMYRVQNYDSIMCGCFYIRFINYMFKGNLNRLY